jgi:hypothetical protein
VSSALAPTFATAAALLVLAGASKLRSPLTARAALAAAGLPVGDVAARLLGAGELVLGAACLAWPTPLLAGSLAAAYLAFAAVVALLLRRGGAVPCGCFGADAFSASRLHAAMDLVAAAVCLAAIAVRPPSILWLPDDVPTHVVLVLGVAGSTYLASMAFALLPGLWRSYGASGRPG